VPEQAAAEPVAEQAPQAAPAEERPAPGEDPSAGSAVEAGPAEPGLPAEAAAEAVEAVADPTDAVDAISAVDSLDTCGEGREAPAATAVIAGSTATESAAEPVPAPAEAGAPDVAEPLDTAQSAPAEATPKEKEQQAQSPDSAGYRPTQVSIPVARTGPAAPARPAQPKPPGPTFTAASPANRNAPRPVPPRPVTPQADYAPPEYRPPYSPYQPGRAQQGAPQSQPPAPPSGANPWTTSPMPPIGSANYQPPPAGAQYAGPSQPYPDLARQYAPGTAGGRTDHRRRRPGRLIALIAAAVIMAVAAGIGAALALHHSSTSENATNAGNTGSAGSTGTAGTIGASGKPYHVVEALNDPQPVPSGWVTKTYPAADFKSDAVAGFSTGLPPGWSAQLNGDHVDFYAPGFPTAGPRDPLFEVDLTPHTYPKNMVAEANYIAQQSRAQGKFPGYRVQAIQPVTVLGVRGAIWQFYWQNGGVTEFTEDILFVKPTPAGAQSYALYLRAPKSGWVDIYLPKFEAILHTFRTVPAS
jgi:hypothetical protein